jgi:DNA repair exonuclease SbcCD ATPase subunit
MLLFKNLSIRNYLSIGNVAQVVNLNNQELTLILGENLDLGGQDVGARSGTGKTTILNALSYCLYSWPISTIKKDNQVNKSNGKNMEVSLEFENDGIEYKIVRGLRPRLLEFYVGGKKHEDKTSSDEAQGDSRETQHEIQKVIGMSFDMFCQIVAPNTYTTPFLMQKTNDQRILIEELLGISMLGERADKLKEEIKTTKDKLLAEEMKINAVNSSNERIHSQIANLKVKKETWDNNQAERIYAMEDRISRYSKIDINQELLVHAQWNEYESYLSTSKELSSQRRSVTSTLTRENKRKEVIEKELISLENSCCQTCGQKLHGEVGDRLLQDADIRLKQCIKEIEDTSSLLAELDNAITSLPIISKPPQKNYSSLDDAHNHKSQLLLLEQEYDSMKNESNPYSDQIDMMKDTALEEVSYDAANELKHVLDHMEFLHKLLVSPSSFIRKKIVEQNLSFLNSRLTHYLECLGLPHDVVVQNDLDIIISEMGRELSVGNLSNGEFRKISLSLSLAFRDIWEHLNYKVSLILIDEFLDSGFDNCGVQLAATLLKKITREREQSIFIITHREEIISSSMRTLLVTKENGFTTFELLKI